MFTKLTPNLMVPDVDQATKFYEGLGFRRVLRVPDEAAEADFAILSAGSVELMLQSKQSMSTDLPPVADQPYGGGCILYLEVDDVADLHASLAGQVTVVVDLRETFYGSTEFYITDPYGYTIGFAQPQSAAPDQAD